MLVQRSCHVMQIALVSILLCVVDLCWYLQSSQTRQLREVEYNIEPTDGET